MAIITLAANEEQYVILISVSPDGKLVEFYDEPIHAWAIDDANDFPTPIMPGLMPAPDPDGYARVALVDIEQDRVTPSDPTLKPELYTIRGWFKYVSGHRKAKSSFASKRLRTEFANYQFQYPETVP